MIDLVFVGAIISVSLLLLGLFFLFNYEDDLEFFVGLLAFVLGVIFFSGVMASGFEDVGSVESIELGDRVITGSGVQGMVIGIDDSRGEYRLLVDGEKYVFDRDEILKLPDKEGSDGRRGDWE